METARTDSTRQGSQAAFLVLRLFDEWLSSGGLVADPEFLAHVESSAAVEAIRGDAELQSALRRVVEAITVLHDPDAQPVLPRVHAIGILLEDRGRFADAADVFATVARHVDVRAHFDLAYDAFMRQGFCLRSTGDLDQADRAYETASMHAGRVRDRSRVLEARIGKARVQWARGDLPAAHEALGRIADEAASLGDQRLRALALNDRADVAAALS